MLAVCRINGGAARPYCYRSTMCEQGAKKNALQISAGQEQMPVSYFSDPSLLQLAARGSIELTTFGPRVAKN
jgi:hypothetical protein